MRLTEFIAELERIKLGFGDLDVKFDKYTGFGDAWHYEGKTVNFDITIDINTPTCFIKGR